jgi:hypothetical protein
LTQPALDNLVRIGHLKAEPRNEAEARRMLDSAHQKRNLAEYEGYLDIEESTIAELCALVAELIADAGKLIEN